MDPNIIVLDSDDEDEPVVNNVIVETPVIAKAGIKRQLIDGSENHNAKLPKIDETIPKRRITPLKIGEVTKDSTVIPFGTENVDIDEDSLLVVQEDSATLNEGEDASKSIQGPESKNIANGGSEGCSSSKTALNEIGPNFQKFINACKKIDDSKDMDKIIQKKLLKYYHAVHPDFINSKVFQKILKKSIEDINETPNDVYVKLKIVIEELDIRRRSNVTVIANEEVAVKGTGDEKKDEHLNKLYKSLLLLKKRILKLEHEDVDFDANELDSSYIMKERFEKRACQTYEKICELTGESSHAHRIIKKPITFKGTDYPQFNKKIQKMVNKNNSFPNYREILRCLDYCNKNHNFKLTQEQMKRIAQDAFEKLGKVLQQRRKTELYESASYFVGSRKDPAKQDGELRVKLEKNKKHYSKITDLIDEFAEKERNSKKEGETDEVTSTSNNNTVKTETPVKVTEKIETITKPANEVHKQTVVNGSETSTIVSSSNTSNIVTLTIEDDDSIILL
ncbi:unnamed protein product [Diamesa serratosioi]